MSLGAHVKSVDRDCFLSALQLACERDLPCERNSPPPPEQAEPQFVKFFLDDNNGSLEVTGRTCCTTVLELAEKTQAVDLLLGHGAHAQEVVVRCVHSTQNTGIGINTSQSGLEHGYNAGVLQLSDL